MAYAPTSELEAVNTILSTIGEAPINTLTSSGNILAEKAKSILHEVSRSVQAQGWHFNTEEDYPITRTVDNEITVPSNALSMDTTKEFADYNVTMRGSRMYDLGEHSFTFDQTLNFNIIFFLPITDLPEAARNYITIRAARTFQARTIGSQELDGYTKDDEYLALITLKKEEGDSGDYNIFTGNSDTFTIIDR